MFSTWDLVRPRYWHPMSTLEQSMMELDYMADRMLRTDFPFRRSQLLTPHNYFRDDDDDFFRDLPLEARNSQRRRSQPAAAAKSETSQDIDMEEANADVPDEKKKKKNEAEASKEGSEAPSRQLEQPEQPVASDQDPRQQCAYSSYSFSSSSVLDDNGHRVVSTRRRYEDSTGRLKALHEREVDGKKLRTVWRRQDKNDQGTHESICSSGSPGEFEKLWSSTPFGVAETKSLEEKPTTESEKPENAALTNDASSTTTEPVLDDHSKRQLRSSRSSP